MNTPNKKSILLVEDESIVRRVHTFILEKANCSVDTAVNGGEALEKSSNEYNLIFMDIGLPDMSGIEVIAKIRQAENGKNKVPIVVLTGFSSEEVGDDSKKAGADAVFLKPITPQKLAQIVEDFSR